MYTGFAIKQTSDEVMLDQNNYVQGIEIPTIDPKDHPLSMMRWMKENIHNCKG